MHFGIDLFELVRLDFEENNSSLGIVVVQMKEVRKTVHLRSYWEVKCQIIQYCSYFFIPSIFKEFFDIFSSNLIPLLYNAFSKIILV